MAGVEDGEMAADGVAGPDAPVRPPQFARRAANMLLLGAALEVVVLGFVLWTVSAAGIIGLAAVTAVGGTVATGAVLLATSLAVSRGRPWAPGAAILVFWVVVLLGVARFLLSLLSGSLTIPIDALIAGWALSAWDRPRRVDLGAGALPTLLPAIVLVVAGVLPALV